MSLGLGLGLFYSGGGGGGDTPPPPSPPVNTVAPVISGTPFVGQTLSCSTGTWTGSPTYSYQWRNNGSNIIGAINSTYFLVSGDNGDTIDCVVTATNGAGSSSANSNEIVALQTILWLDASDTSTITQASGSVSAIADKSGNGYNFSQGSASIQPLTGTQTINGLNVLVTKSGDCMDGGGGTLRTILAAGGYDVFCLFAADTTTGSKRIIQVSNGAAVSTNIMNVTSAGQINAGIGENATTTGASNDTNPHISWTYSTPTEVTVGRDGATDGVSSTPTLPTTVTQATRIFRDYNNTNTFIGRFGEILIFPTLTGPQKGIVKSWMSSKWGVTI